MTAVNSSKGLFVTYFKYRLGIMKMNFVMCCILNVLGLPLLAVAANKGFGGVISEFSATARFFSMICIAALPAIAIFNALSSFDYYHKKDLTDTIGVLPLSHKQRFFADLLAGLIVNAVPIIPCGIFCVIVFGNMQGKLLARYEAAMLGNFHMVNVGLYIAAAVLFIVVFTYLFTVLTSVCCGKVFHSVVFSVIAIVILPLLFGGLARCFANWILGIDSKEYFWEAVKFFPPAGLLRAILDVVEVPFSGYSGYFIRKDNDIARLGFGHILVYLILAAGIIALAYFLGKRRLAEHTGSAFAIKPMFWVLSGGITAAMTIMTLCTSSEFYAYGGIFHSYHIFSAAAGLLTCLVTVLLYRQKKKTFLHTLIVGAGAVVVMLAAWVVVDKTGSFGARYYPKSADEIEYIKINSTYKITEKKDIEDFTSMLNKELHDNPSGLAYGDWGGFFVEMKKTDGTSIARNYTGRNLGEQILRSLDGYLDYFFGELEDSPEEWKAYLSYRYMSNSMVSSARTWVHDEDVDELIKILHEEAKEKHDPNAKTVIEIVFYGLNRERSFAIGEDFTRTIAFLSEATYDLDDNHSVVYLSIEYSGYGVDRDVFSVKIPFADKDDARVKELVSLLEASEGEPVDPNFRMRVFSGSNEPGVTEENKPRVLELMRELAADYMFN